MSKWSALPVAAPGGNLLPHMSARLRTNTIDAVFEGMGGFQAFLAWAESTPDTRTEFYKMYAKGAAKATSVEVGVSDSIEAIWEKLERAHAGENAKIIDCEAEEVEG